MKRDKEWLLDTFRSRQAFNNNFSKGYVLEKVKQLDEPDIEGLEEKIEELYEYNNELIRDNNQLRTELDNQETLSQRWIGKNEFLVNDESGVDYTVVESRKLKGVLVPKQEVPVIPNYVANWIEKNKKQDKSLVFAIAHIYDKNAIGEIPSEEENRIFRWMELDDNEEVFARAWLDGFTVEEEQKYYAKVKGWEVFEKNSHHPYWDVLKPFGKDERLTISTFGSRESLTKEEWNNLGLNENNADFVKVEELEE